MTAQRRRRSSFLLLSLVSCSASAVGASAEPARNVLAVEEKISPTAGNKYRPSSEARNNKEKAEGRKSLRGLKHASNDDHASYENINADQSQRIQDVIDLAAPLFDEAVIPSPLEPPKAGKNDHQEATSSTAERDLKKDKDDKKDDNNDKEIKHEVTIIEPGDVEVVVTRSLLMLIEGIIFMNSQNRWRSRRRDGPGKDEQNVNVERQIFLG